MSLSENDFLKELNYGCSPSVYGSMVQQGRRGWISFNVIAATFYEHYDEILNFYNNRSTNAMAESFNAKIKLFRANLRGVADKKFFLFRIANLYGYPH